MQAQRSALAYELLHEQLCLVMYKAPRETSECEWDGYLEVARSALPYGNELRFIVWNEEGNMPRNTQIKVTDMMRGYTHKVAVISPSTVARFIVAIFALWNRNVRGFGPSQLEEAYQYLGYHGAARTAVAACLERLQIQANEPVSESALAP